MTRSGFDRGIEILRTLDFPVFEQMAKTGRAIVLVRGAAREIKAAVAPSDFSRVMRGFNLLRMSHKYCAAVLKKDAQRHALDGTPVEPVDAGARLSAKANITGMRGTKKPAAPAPSPSRPILKLKSAASRSAGVREL